LLISRRKMIDGLDEGEQKGLCPNCLKGGTLQGTPKGRFEEIGGIKTYVGAGEAPVEHKDKAILLLTDVFGHGLVNNLLIADGLAQAASMNVYVPDLFNGDWALPERFDGFAADEPGGQPKMGLISRVVMIVRDGIPFLFRHRAAITQPIVERSLAAIKELGMNKICAVGYCFGGKYSINLSAGKVDAAVHCHPSLWSNAEVENIDRPTLLLAAEEDQQMKESHLKAWDEIFKKKSVPFEKKMYPGTVHGFMARPDPNIPAAMAGFEDGNGRIAEFVKRHL